MTNTAQVFKKAFGNSGNFMTPDFIKYGRVGDKHYEVSGGKGFSGENIYGLTVVTYNQETHDLVKEYDISEMYTSLDDIDSAIKEL